MKARRVFRGLIISGSVLLLGWAIYSLLFRPTVSISDAGAPEGEATAAAGSNPKVAALSNKHDSPHEAANPSETPPAVSPRVSTPETADAAQQREFGEFLDKANRFSESVHEEFRLLEELSARHQGVGEDTNHLVFQKMRVEFDDLGRRAATNENALQLLLDAAHMRYLQGLAVAGLGVAAENGNNKAVELLLEPEKNGWLVSSSAGALVNVARAGNDDAIGFMRDLAFDPAKTALWGFAADGLQSAAASGDEEAISALVNISASGNDSLRKKVLQMLETAASAGSPQASAAANSIRARPGNQ